MSANENYNRARREKMEKHNCWNCDYYPSNCNPLGKCRNDNEKEEK